MTLFASNPQRDMDDSLYIIAIAEPIIIQPDLPIVTRDAFVIPELVMNKKHCYEHDRQANQQSNNIDKRKECILDKIANRDFEVVE